MKKECITCVLPNPATPEDVKKVFVQRGVTVSEWAAEHGFSRMLVYSILRGQRKCLRGESHRIAVALRLKNGDEVHSCLLSKEACHGSSALA